MFKIDEHYSDYYDGEDPKYPGGAAVNSTGSDTFDGTPWLAKMFNNCIGWMQALYIKAFGSLAGISGDAENAQKSDVVDALEKIRADNNAAERATSDEKYFPFAGGTIDGDAEVAGTFKAGASSFSGNVEVGSATNKKNATVNGNLNVNGNIYQQGSSYETHAEKLYTKKDIIFTRDGATTGLASGAYTGLQAVKYDGTNDGQLVYDKDGTARVGDVGKTVPLAARSEAANMTDGYGVTWDAATQTLQTTFLPAGAVVPTEIKANTTVSSIVADRSFYITAASAVTLTLGAGTVGVKVRIMNTKNVRHTISCTSVNSTLNAMHILPYANFEIMWNGSAWQNVSGKQIGDIYSQEPQHESPFDVFPCSDWVEEVQTNGTFRRTTNAPTTFYSKDGTNFYRDIERTQPISFSGLGTATATGSTSYNSKGEAVKHYSGNWTTGNANAFIEKSGNLVMQKDCFQGHEHLYTACDGGSGTKDGGVIHRSPNSHTYGIVSDNSHGEPRVGDETRPKNYTIRVWKRTA